MAFHPDFCQCKTCLNFRYDLATRQVQAGQSLVERHPELLQNVYMQNTHPTPPRVVDKRAGANPERAKEDYDAGEEAIKILANKWYVLTPEQKATIRKPGRIHGGRLEVGIIIFCFLLASIFFAIVSLSKEFK